MTLDEIDAALHAKNMGEIEKAFAALVGYPYAETVESGARKALFAALKRVCEALSADEAKAPEATCSIIHGMTPGHESLSGATYAQAAAFVAEHADLWRERFDDMTGYSQG